MSDFNSQKNRAVWFDIPVANLDRAAAFYAEVLDVKVHRETMGEMSFGVIDHQDGNGGCLVINPAEVGKSGVLIYLNADHRIRDAVRQVEAMGGRVLEPIHSIGPHGFRAVVLDSEGNRVALHSNTDA
jgi:predicted enzyme related to lactoylglutathione lyase